MTQYRRMHTKGATYFFTVNCAKRGNNSVLVENIERLRQSFRKIKRKHPFTIDAIVILPEHLHCIWTLPANDSDYPTRWGLIKAHFSRGIPKGEKRSLSRQLRGERGIWQRRYWEHQIRGDQDYQRHVDYIHWNPVKHGWVNQPSEWPYSSFHAFVRQGILPSDWAGKTDNMETGER